MYGNSTVGVVVEGGGDQVVAHVGLHALGAFADRLGLGDSLSARIPIGGERFPLHDRGKVLTQAMLMFAGGGEACSDIEHLRAQGSLFGSVPSDSTLHRTFRQMQLIDLDRATMAAWYDGLDVDGRTRNQLVAIVRSLVRWGVQRGRISRDEFLAPLVTTTAGLRRTVPAADDLSTLLRHLIGPAGDPLVFTIVYLAAATGARRASCSA